ncbi:protein-methionine-sulfoxide reductase heme-binding subunit MsrQ [Aliigemmobacter aestuarii]|uniref:Protein-methionine-sulfoxide reductase heme-binding subunit MsrQ n=1 Tax=Aliigemmobacter aestuarii TaxID=1445661 RepID=A0A4S3MT61_9RHOB|nr:protein-methionine-sulfoxide reductase heme-binding subunit MsrQ [Gemmobacter aestuarii]THD85779.1 protein-methionine-sulfoxide reductase heme-binding subunit MsrQ [Gemmobacter aestuarii]
MDRVNALLRRLPVGAVYLAGVLPFVWTFGRGLTGGLGVDPVKALEQALGLYALQFLVAVLAVTPLRRHLGLNLLRFRRALGVLAFLYMALHLLVWVTLDLQFRWAEIGADLVKRPHIVVGMAAFLLALPLALTSNDAALRRLGGLAWRRLHRLTYVVLPLGAIHFVMLSKTWALEPLAYLAAAILLLVLRLNPRRAAA